MIVAQTLIGFLALVLAFLLLAMGSVPVRAIYDAAGPYGCAFAVAVALAIIAASYIVGGWLV